MYDRGRGGKAAPRHAADDDLSLALCDRRHGVVLEMTPKSVVARHPSDGILACTNHFRSDELAVWPMPRLCHRYQQLIQSRQLDQLDVADGGQEAGRGRAWPDDRADDDFRAGGVETAPGDRLLPLLGAAAAAVGDSGRCFE